MLPLSLSNRHGADATRIPTSAAIEVEEEHPRHPPKRRQTVARRILIFICVVFCLGLVLLVILPIATSKEAARSEVLRSERNYESSEAAHAGMGGQRFPQPHAAAEVALAARAPPQAGPTEQRQVTQGQPGPHEGAPLPQLGGQTHEQLLARMEETDLREREARLRMTPQERMVVGLERWKTKKCPEDYPYAHCRADLVTACSRFQVGMRPQKYSTFPISRCRRVSIGMAV